MPHIHEKIDLTVEVFIVHGDKVLLRMHDKYKLWLSVGGHVELDEDPNQAAVREVKEEVGLDITLWNETKLPPKDEFYSELIPPFFLNRHRVSDTHEHVTMVYFATSDSDQVHVEYAGDTSNDWKWATLEDLKTMDLKPHVRFYAETALKKICQ